MSYQSLGQRAIGPRDGDTLELRNQWARVTITCVYIDGAHPDKYAAVYWVTGDLLDLRLQRFECRTMGAAMSYAMQSLAVYQEGRMS